VKALPSRLKVKRVLTCGRDLKKNLGAEKKEGGHQNFFRNAEAAKRVGFQTDRCRRGGGDVSFDKVQRKKTVNQYGWSRRQRLESMQAKEKRVVKAGRVSPLKGGSFSQREWTPTEGAEGTSGE